MKKDHPNLVQAQEVIDVILSYIPLEKHSEALDHIIHHYAGTVIHFPFALRHMKRNEDICHRFNGQNWKALCIEFRISRAHLYRIISRKKIFSCLSGKGE